MAFYQNLINEHKSAVCLSLDTTTFGRAEQILEICAPYICMVKLHPELFMDWDPVTHPQKISEWRTKYNIAVLLDAKLVDVPEISYRFITNPHYRATEWADMVTVMTVNYIAITDYFRSRNMSITTIPVTEMNCPTSSLFKYEAYRSFVKSLITGYPWIIGIINQRTYSQVPGTENILKMTPGIVVYETEITPDNCLRYRTIKEAMVDDGNDIVIIGGSLIRETVHEKILQKIKVAASATQLYSKFMSF
jgi:orotidine-5'-phosphate decarboxylase